LTETTKDPKPTKTGRPFSRPSVHTGTLINVTAVPISPDFYAESAGHSPQTEATAARRPGDADRPARAAKGENCCEMNRPAISGLPNKALVTVRDKLRIPLARLVAGA